MTAAPAGPPAFSSIPVGVDREPQNVHDAHSAPQRAFVARIVARSDFAYACENPFTLEQKAHRYSGPFWFLWYDTSDQLHAVKVGVLGRVLKEVIPGTPPAPQRDATDPLRMF